MVSSYIAQFRNFVSPVTHQDHIHVYALTHYFRLTQDHFSDAGCGLWSAEAVPAFTNTEEVSQLDKRTLQEF